MIFILRFLIKSPLYWSLLFLIPCVLVEAHDGIKVRFVKRFNNVIAGQETTLQVYLTNQRPHSVILVGHLDLPKRWKAVPANDILIHLMPYQNIVQTLVIKVPDYEREGEFPLFYEVWGRDNSNIYDKDESTILIRYPTRSFKRENEFCFFANDLPFENVVKEVREIQKIENLQPVDLIKNEACQSVDVLPIENEVEISKTKEALLCSGEPCKPACSKKSTAASVSFDQFILKNYTKALEVSNQKLLYSLGQLSIVQLEKFLQELSPHVEPDKSISHSISEIHLAITSEERIVAASDEMVFISCLIKNKTNELFKDHLSMILPDGWQIVPGKKVEFEISPQDSFLQIFGIKIPSNVPAGNYTLYTQIEAFSLQSAPVFIEIPSRLGLKVQVENMAPCYSLNQQIDLDLTLLNGGNAPITVRLEAQSDPDCDLLFRETAIDIPCPGQYVSTLHIEPDLTLNDDKQFILLKVLNDCTNEVLYQDTLTLCFTPNDEDDEDPYVRIPSHVSMIALGENNDHVFAFEWGGEGIIDPERDRYVEFLFRLPTDSRNVIYSVDQRLYFGMGEPGWDLDLGDTVYSLSPLTQRYRYGRGGGLDIENEDFTGGVHYTQNTYNNDYNPKEACGYLGYTPTEKLYLTGNYLHRNVQDEPTSNLFSIASEYRLMQRVYTELELGKNFVNHVGQHDPYAFRFDTRGQIAEDTWFDVEKIYAGSAFFGYYNDVDLLSGIVDFPINCPMRANVSMTYLKQNFDQDFDHQDRDEFDDCYSIRQRQRQYNANLTYNFFNGASLTFNGLLLRAWDKGEESQYNFNQQWGGLTTSFCVEDWNLVGIVAFGRQKDYLTGNTQSFLQRYWCCASKQLTEDFFSSVFYEGGNTNYYDARPWRTTFGGSLGYRYSSNGFAEIFLQRVQNKPDMYELNQVSFKLCQTFPNRHCLEVSSQYFNYKTHYENDFLFLVSYTIPFALPVGRRSDVGNLSGYVQDINQGVCIPQAMVNVGGRQCMTNSEGNFAFKNLKTGTHDLKVEILPKQLITHNSRNQAVTVLGGKNNEVNVPVISACSISGEVVLYAFNDSIEAMMNQDLPIEERVVKKRSLPGIRVTINRNHGEEVYTAVTNEKGTFHFSHLRPGEWSVKVSEERLPTHHYLNTNPVSFTLESDEHQKLTFDVLPLAPKILPLE